MNLMSMAMKYIGPAVAERIAAKMGIGGPVVNKLIAAALPAIMGSLIGKSNSSSGLGGIMDLITGDNKPSANALTDMFDADGDVDALAQSGSGMLEGLLGGQGMSGLAGALGRHAGVDESQAGSILGMLAPAALGTVGDQVAEQGLDGPGLASFLQGQAGNVAEAMPSGFSSELDGLDLFDGMQLDGFTTNISDGIGAATAAATGAAAAATGAAASAAGDAMSAANTAASAVQDEAKKSMGMLPWIIGVIAIALIAWFFLGRGDDMPDVSAITDQELIVGDVNIGEEFGSITGSLTETFTGITDTASAQEALPQLNEISDKIGTLSESTGELTGVAQTGFQSIVATALEQLRPVIETAIESSGAGGILQPIADQILAALEGMAG